MERIKGQNYPPVSTEIEAIKSKDEEEQDAEVWNSESICYRYYNMLQMFKVNNKVSVIFKVNFNIALD